MSDLKRKNVLIMPISMFPLQGGEGVVKLSKNVYELDNEIIEKYPHLKKSRTGIVQQEAGAKTIIDIISYKNEQIDCVYFLTTDKTSDKKMVLVEDGELQELSAEDCIKEQLVEYFERERINVDQQIFKKTQIDRDKLEKSLFEVVSFLRTLNDGKDLGVYLVTNGGFRDSLLICEAIISLLDKEGAKIEEIILPGVDGSKYTLSYDKGMEIFKFVSGITEFRNSGKVDALSEWYKEKNNDNKELIEIIKIISEGIQLGNIPNFEKGIEELRVYFDSRNKEYSKITYLSLFEQEIYNDYKTLLKKTIDVIDEIEWCRTKGFFQQAVTLIEGRLPKYMAENHFLICDYDCKERIKSKKTPYEINNKIFGGYISQYIKKVDERLALIRKANYDNCKPNKEKRIEILMGKNQRYYTSINSIFNYTDDSDVERKFIIFMNLSSALRFARNQFNHANLSDANITTSQIDRALSLYIKLAKELRREALIMMSDKKTRETIKKWKHINHEKSKH